MIEKPFFIPFNQNNQNELKEKNNSGRRTRVLSVLFLLTEIWTPMPLFPFDLGVSSILGGVKIMTRWRNEGSQQNVRLVVWEGCYLVAFALKQGDLAVKRVF